MPNALRALATAGYVGILVAGGSAGVLSQTPNDSLLSRARTWFGPVNRSDGPGCAFGISRNGQRMFGGYGMADLEASTGITPASRFQLGSVSKQFTAFVILSLAHAGKASLEEDVHRWLPELPNYGVPMRVRDLLWHTSGLRDIYDLIDIGGATEATLTMSEFWRRMVQQRTLNFQPGTHYLYSNSDYGLLALIAERIERKSFRAVAESLIFRPLGMNNSHFSDDLTELIPLRAHTYDRGSNGPYAVRAREGAAVGWTGLFSTVSDFMRWDANLDDGRVGGVAVVADLERPGQLRDGTPIPYAGGLEITSVGDAVRISHGGADEGYVALMAHFPKTRSGGVILCNTTALEPWPLGDSLTAALLGRERTHSAAPPDALPRGVTLDSLAGTYVDTVVGSATTVRIDRQNLVLGRDGPALRAAGGLRFQLGVLPIWFTFVRSPAGGFLLERQLFGVERRLMRPLKRVGPPSHAQMVELSGDYVNRDVGRTFAVRLVGDSLLITEPNGGGLPLRPLGDGWYRWNGSTLRAQSDATGAVVRLLLTTATLRTWNLPFDRTR